VMPAFFLVMALRAEIRVLQVMTGNRWAEVLPEHRPHASWEQVELTYGSLYITNLEAGSMFQYLTVWAFAVLCCRYLNLEHMLQQVQEKLDNISLEMHPDQDPREANKEFMEKLNEANDEQHRSLVFGGLQGIWAYILVGMARSVFDITAAILKVHGWNQQAIELQRLVLTQLSPIFAFTAAMCVYNSIVIFSMKAIRDESAFGKFAAIKFAGTRALLLIAQFQPVILRRGGEQLFGFSQAQQRLMNTCLLIMECLCVALFNMWSFRVSQVGAGMRPGSLKSSEVEIKAQLNA